MRADEILVSSGQAESRSQAQLLIMAGQISTIAGSVVDKASREFPGGTIFKIKTPSRYVGRGGEKLEGFFTAHGWNQRYRHALDIGASTGGFTDCLLQLGVESVTCVDVGHGQLHHRLRLDKRVTNLERVNARQLVDAPLPRRVYDLITIDLSFISLRMVLPTAWPLLNPDGLLVALIKPQFEASKREVDACRGVVRDGEIHRRVREEIRQFSLCHLPGAQLAAEMESPLQGADGNREFFIGLVHQWQCVGE